MLPFFITVTLFAEDQISSMVLPLSDEGLDRAMYDCGICKPEDECAGILGIFADNDTITECLKGPFYDLSELNYLAQRLSALSPSELELFDTVCTAKGCSTAEELINEAIALPHYRLDQDGCVDNLNEVNIARPYKSKCENWYRFPPYDYDTHYVFRVEVILPGESDPLYLRLPASEATLWRALGHTPEEGCTVRCVICPHFSGLIPDHPTLQALNDIAKRYGPELPHDSSYRKEYHEYEPLSF